MSNQSNASNEKPQTVQDIIRETEQKSEGGGYIYRGERNKKNLKVSSKLYRDFEIENEHFDIELVQKEMLAAAKKHTGDLPQDFRLDITPLQDVTAKLIEEARDFEILTEIQHYGGKTNLIDFTTDYFIALFFACDGRYEEDGRVILQKTDEIRDMIAHPRNPRHRVIVQKSVFIRPPRGFIEPHENDIVIIPAKLKQPLLQYLRDYHGISTEFIYNDLHGFIKNQDIHGDAYTHFYRGFAFRNRADEATTSETKQEEYEKAITHYTKAIELKPDEVSAYNGRGTVYVRKGDFDNAMQDYTKALELKPDEVYAYNGRGNVYRGKREFDNAIEDYTKALELKPDEVYAYSRRGTVYVRKGDFDNAIQDYTKAIELKPDQVRAYRERGMVYARKGDFDNAIQDYTKAIELKPDQVHAYYNMRARVYVRKGDLDNAIKDHTTIIELKPDYANAYYDRGIVYKDKGDLDNAIQDYTKAIELKPGEDYAYYSRRARVYVRKGDLDNAIKDYTTAIQIGPNYVNAYYNRGDAYRKKGDFDNAIKDHTKLIELKPNSASVYYKRGVLQLHLQEWEKARQDLIDAKNIGMNIIASFHNDYESVADFEKGNGFKLPEDIAEMLTPQ